MALDTSLIEYWKCDESSGTNVSGSLSAYSGTLSGTSSWGAGKINNGFTLSAAGSFFKSTISSGLSSSFSVAGWVNFTNSGTNEFIFNSHVTSYDNYWFMVNRNTSNQIQGNLYDGTNNPNTTSTVTVGSGVWTHIAFVRDTVADTISIYINGILGGSTTDTTTSVPTYGTFGIGEDRNPAGDRDFAGSIDEMGLWSRALTADDVSRLYNADRGNQYPFTDDLTTSIVSYWKLDEASGNAADSFGGVTLTNNNTVTYSTGLINNGADMGSSNTNKNLTSSNDLGIGSGVISVSAWIKPSSYPSSDSDPTPPTRFNIFGVSDTTAGVSYFMHISNVSSVIKCIFSRWRNSVAIAVADYTYTPPTSSWTHVVGTYDGTTVKVYVNDNTPGSITQSGTGSGGPDGLAIGSNNSSGAYYSGMIDEVGVWKRALLSTEVTELYNGGVGRQYPFIVTFSVNVSDLITTTESITKTGPDININKSDSITVSESVSMSNTLAGISVSDSITITESVTARSFSFLSVSDNITVSEDFSVSTPVTSFAPVVNDVLTISESVSVAMALSGSVNVVDSIQLTETKTTESIYIVSVSDSLSTAESISIAHAASMAASVVDSITVSESHTVAIDFLGDVSVSDSITLTESRTINNFFNITIADTISLSESINNNLSSNLSVYDLITISEGVSTESVFEVVIHDSVVLSEGLTMESFRFSPDMPGKIIGTMMKRV